MGSAENGERRTWVDLPAARPSSEPGIKDAIGAGFTHRAESRFDEPTAGAFEGGGRADRLPPCGVLAELTGQALDADLRRLTDDELVGVMHASGRVVSWQERIRLAAIDELASRRQTEVHDAGPAPAERTAAEIAVALTLPAGAAARLVDFATGLAMLEDVGEWLRRGEIDARKAEVFVQELAPLPWLQASIIAIRHLQAATEMTSAQLRDSLRRAVLAADPEAGKRRQREARKDARVEWWTEHSGNGALAGRELPAARAMLADEHITALAKSLRTAGLSGSLEQVKTEVFLALVTGQSPDALISATPDRPAPNGDDPVSRPPHDNPAGRPGGETSQGTAAPFASDTPPAPAPAFAELPRALRWPTGPLGTVHLTMPLSAWLGQTNNPGEIAGYGPADAWTCRDMAGTMATWDGTRYCLTITTEEGQPLGHACTKSAPPWTASAGQPDWPGPAPPRGPTLRDNAGDPVPAWLASLRIEWLQRGDCDHSRETSAYRPSRQLEHLIKIRNPTCTAPGCRRPAQRCDIDHVVPYHLGGRTCECNCQPGCRRHHRCKGSAGWHLEMPEPGVLVWRLPHGRSYTSRTDPYPV
jgi:Domain of unknown function (DUF222)